MKRKLKDAKALMEQAKQLQELPVKIDLTGSKPVKVDKTLAKKLLGSLNTPKTRRALLVAAGAATVAAVSGTTAKYQFHRSIVASELKKKLEPLHAEIEQLQQTIDDLNLKLDLQKED